MAPREIPLRSATQLPDRRRRRGGFTLAELLVSVVILGVLAAALIPNYIRYVYQARRSEAFSALRAIHDAQAYHYANKGEYSGSFEELGFELEGGALRSDGAYEGGYYTYTLNRWDLGDEPNANYRATATGDLDKSDATLDIVIIENALTVKD
jgi:prepilin-type N-terminal cleavage/methylation domain-containing protein